MFKGKMGWIPSDVMTELYEHREPTMTVADALRDYMGLPIPEPAVVAEKLERRFDVTMLNIGDEVRFSGVTLEALTKIIKKQSKGTGRQYQMTVTNDHIQVIRTK